MCEIVNKCIYCNSSDLTNSDIIPYALTGAKIARKFVCKAHNTHTNDEFESEVIKQWGCFRNELGLSTRDGDTVKYKANIIIDDIVIKNVNISDKKFFYANTTQLLTTNYNGKKLKIGHIDKLKQIKGAKPTLLDMKNVSIQYNFSLPELIASEKMKRTIAKISYEWYCYENNLTGYDERYQELVSYILEGGPTDRESPVQNVVELHAFLVADQLCEFGTNSLFSYTDVDGCCYVIFNFWNVVIYKTRIFDTKVPNKSTSETFHLKKFNLDGTKDDNVFGICGQISISSVQPEEAVRKLQMFYLGRLNSLVSTKILSLFAIEQLINEMNIDLTLLKTGSIDISNFLNYEEWERIFTIQLTIKFAETKEKYNTDIGFNGNLNAILDCGEFLRVEEQDKIVYLELIMDLYKNHRLTKLLDEGIIAFKRIYDLEREKLDL
jgi:hypothetical protein